MYCEWVTGKRREEHMPIKRAGPLLSAERDSVLLRMLPGNYDVTAAHDKEVQTERGRDRYGYYEQM